LIESYTGTDLQGLAKVAILPKYYENDDKTIYFFPGVCSLQQLLDNPEFRSTPDQAVYIFSVLLEFVLLMREKGYRHSDLKPENTWLLRSQDD
jgi:serine/threonine protein kinase